MAPIASISSATQGRRPRLASRASTSVRMACGRLGMMSGKRGNSSSRTVRASRRFARTPIRQRSSSSSGVRSTASEGVGL